MKWYQKLIAGTKFLVGGWESALEYALGLLNAFLSSGVTADRVAKGYSLAMNVLYYAKKYRTYCPSVWLQQYDATVAAVERVALAFEDGKLELDEVSAAAAALARAVEAWRS